MVRTLPGQCAIGKGRRAVLYQNGLPAKLIFPSWHGRAFNGIRDENDARRAFGGDNQTDN